MDEDLAEERCWEHLRKLRKASISITMTVSASAERTKISTSSHKQGPTVWIFLAAQTVLLDAGQAVSAEESLYTFVNRFV